MTYFASELGKVAFSLSGLVARNTVRLSLNLLLVGISYNTLIALVTV